MKKILIATIEFPPQKGGIANYLAGLAEALPHNKVVMLAPRYSGAQSFDSHQPYKVYRKKLFFRFFWPKWLSLIWHLWRVVRREKIETILVSQVLPVGMAAMILNKFLRLPYFVSCHGMDILTAEKSPHKKRLMDKILEQAAGIVANSDFTRKELMKLGVSDKKITIVYPCLSGEAGFVLEKVEKIKNMLRLADKKIILTVGRLVARKGHDKVIEALPKILEKVPNAIYVIVGDGPNRVNLVSKIKSFGLENNTLFVGEISEERKKAFYQLCDLFIMVPRQIGADVEGFGTVFLEANQYGKPVVGGKSGGVVEAVLNGVTGIIVDSTDTEQIVEAVTKLLTDKDLANKLGQQGKERAEREFRWTVQVEKVKDLIS